MPCTRSNARQACLLGAATISMATLAALQYLGSQSEPAALPSLAPAVVLPQDARAVTAESVALPREDRADAAAIVSTVTPAAALDLMSVGIVVEPRTSEQAGVPVTVLWRVDPESLRALQTELITDGQGMAVMQVEPFRNRPPLFWADYGFPTLGAAARPIPEAGGEVALASLPLGWLEIEVTEHGGMPLHEAARVQVRCVTARPLGDRWHQVDLRDGRARLRVEAASLPLRIDLQTASGRRLQRDLAGPDGHGDTRQERIELPMAPCQRLLLRDPHGAALPHCGVRLLRLPSATPIDDYVRTTDSVGELRLPSALFAAGMVGLVTEGLQPAFAVGLSLDERAATELRMEVTLQEVAPTAAGVVVDEQGRPLAGQWVRLEASAPEHTKDGARQERGAWRRLAAQPTDATGAFVIGHPVALDSELRLVVEGPFATSTGATMVRAGQVGVRIQVR